MKCAQEAQGDYYTTMNMTALPDQTPNMDASQTRHETAFIKLKTERNSGARFWGAVSLRSRAFQEGEDSSQDRVPREGAAGWGEAHWVSCFLDSVVSVRVCHFAL